MAKFTYIGVDEAADPNGTQAFGLYFPVGEPVEVEDKAVAAKLAGHPHFKASRWASTEADDVESEKKADDEPKRRGRPPKARED